ncbi:hypothetical protein [Peribacillus acanthi]|uniref:hypothetical protein n=1 Tax=Peribacillus acanthi TaxID=2171554 RepID=UPI000D3E4DFA|nr:hypothetical protein [Peribacillus acanthi]
MIRGVIAGVVAGLGLGFLLKGMEKMTGIPVYSLLLNVDFIPFFRAHPLSEIKEFLLHLLVSISIGVVYMFFVTSNKITSYKIGFLYATLLTLPAILLFFPLSYLAVDRIVPKPNDFIAIALWVFSHLVYCLILSLFIKRKA